VKKQRLLVVSLIAGLVGGTFAADTAATASVSAVSQVAPMYALDFVGTAATGYDLNDLGDVVGKSYTDPGCGPFCLPPQELVVWRAGQRIVLPLVPGFESGYQFPLYINNQGLIGGEAWVHVAIWMPNATGYTAQDLGAFPGMSSADAFGLDDQGRMVGWSTLGGAIPTRALPFMWSQATGMVDLKALGYPNERPAAMSPGGAVVTTGSWYQLGNPASAVPLPPLPRGFVGAGSNGSAINDAGDQAHFLVSTSTQNLVYPFRLSNGGAWQMLSTFGTGHLSRSGMGSINAAQDVTFTAGSTGIIAAGPADVGQALAPLLSPAYAGATIGQGGPMNASGQILTQVMIGRSERLMKMTPATACRADCLISSSLVMTGQFVQDPKFPGSCFEGGTMYNVSSATVTITSETGVPLRDVQVSGRFLDDYWTNRPVTGTTNASGVVSWTHRGPCGVGAIAFLVENASAGTRSFDRTRGMLTNYVIPGTTPPPANEAPISSPVVNCVAGRTCTFDGSGSFDPDGSIVAYRWAENNGATLSTEPVFTRTFTKSGKNSAILHVTDDGGLTASKKVTFTVLR
jgi:PKD domain